jgi:hypothetical protein
MAENRSIEIACPSGMSEGRCQLILGTALAFAVAAIDGLSGREQPSSDRDDMVAIFTENFPNEVYREMLMAQVERKLGYTPDMTDCKTAGE